MGMEFKEKIMLYCFGEVKCKQNFTTEIWYYLYNALGSIVSMCISGLMLASQNSSRTIRDRFLGANFTKILLNYFDDSNEEIMGREQKEEVLWWNVGKHR